MAKKLAGKKSVNKTNQQVGNKMGKLRAAVGARAGASRAKKSGNARAKAWAGITSEAVERATGKTWDQWCKLLDKDGAAKIPHKEIALHVRKKYAVGDWWCQMVTVGYEQARGLRVKHQTATGYIANLSKTIPVSLAAAFDAVADAKQRSRWLKESVTDAKATAGKTVRFTWHDSSRVIVGFWDKTGKSGEPKTQVVFQHEKLKDVKAVERAKEFWRIAVGKLESSLT